MSTAPLPATLPGATLPERLAELLRPEFTGDLIRIDPDNPIFARGHCQVTGCDRGAWTRMLCNTHYGRWLKQGRPDLAHFAATTAPVNGSSDRIDAFDLRRLPPGLRAEVAYSIQCRHDERSVRLIPMMINRLVDLLLAAQVTSLLDHPLPRWKMLAHQHGLKDTGGRAFGQLGYAWRHLHNLTEERGPEAEFARDTWRAAVLGARPSGKGITTIRFDHITQPWLRTAIKRACRYRLGAGKSFGSVSIDERALRWFTTFLTDHHPEVTDPSGITRPILEHYLSFVTAAPQLSGNTTNSYLVVLRAFLQACHRHDWMPGLPAQACLYIDELPPRPQPLPRFIPEFVMAQLEDPDNLARLPDATTRHLLVLIQETGLRARDACILAFNPIIADSAGAPCLQYYNTKTATEQLVPLSARATEAIRTQQGNISDRWPDGGTCLFPSPVANPDGVRPFTYATLRHRLAAWQQDVALHDETGQSVRVTAHQFRHTLGTRALDIGRRSGLALGR